MKSPNYSTEHQIFLMSKVLPMFLFEICISEEKVERREGKQIWKQTKWKLWHYNICCPVFPPFSLISIVNDL